ncbi:hypothetical protein M9Y10_009660 [Tritrichomonas musculus]|uniref:HECT domain-containing protein n=1 Tax=Tritrichomonas musculus TaxID=1915356 RepID=A0ABR2IQR9_9EUKA
MESLLSSASKTPSSLIDILKNDDTERLKSIIDANPEISISTFITFAGRSLPVGAVTAAMHYKAIGCLKLLPKTFETYGCKMGGPSAAHVACENQWEPGLQILMNDKVPLNTFDGSSKSPLAYVAEHENIHFFRLFLRYFDKNKQVENGLKNVALGSEGSLDFLSYCVEFKKTVMIEACNYAMKLKFISKNEIRNAIKRWKEKYPYETMPLFLRTFNDTFSLQDQSDIKHIFSPLVPTSKFAEINSPHSIPIFNAISKINKLCGIVNFNLPNLDEDQFTFNKNILFGNYPETIESNEDLMTNYFTPYGVLKKYFSMFIEQMLVVDNYNYLIPQTKFLVAEVWTGFGTVLAHIGYTGCHYHFDYPLHPLIYTVLSLNDPKDLDKMKTEDIEQYFLIIRSNKKKKSVLLEARKKGNELFLERNKDFITEYDNKLTQSWNIEIRCYKNVLAHIHKGFYRETSNERLTRFQSEIKNMDPATIRMWFEGIDHSSSVYNISKQLFFKVFMRENDGGILRANHFIRMFKEWLRDTDKKVVINFLTALLGTKVLLPIENTFKTLFIISNPQENTGNPPIPYIIVPSEEAVIPIMNSKDEINEFANRLFNDQKILYVEREVIMKDLYPLNYNNFSS